MPRHSELEPRLQSLQSPTRFGLAHVELLVSAALVGVLFGILSTLSYQLNKVYRDARNYQTAIHELANQLEAIIPLSNAEAQAAINQLQPSEIASERLQNITLQGKLIEDINGTRVQLSIQWDRMGPAPPLVLVAWLQGESISDAISTATLIPSSPTLNERNDL